MSAVHFGAVAITAAMASPGQIAFKTEIAATGAGRGPVRAAPRFGKAPGEAAEPEVVG